MGTLFKYSGRSKSLSKKSYSRLVRYQRNVLSAIFKKSVQGAALQNGAFFHKGFKERFNSTVIISSSLVSILSQPHYFSSNNVVSSLSSLTALPSLFKNLYGPATLSKLLRVSFSTTSGQRFSKRPAHKRIIGDKGLPGIDVNLTTIGDFLGYYLSKGTLSSINVFSNANKRSNSSVFSFLKRKIAQKEKEGLKLPKAKSPYPFLPVMQDLERDFYEGGNLNSYWYLEKRGWLPVMQLLDGVKHPLSY